MADKPFDPTKPVQTRDGRKARILATDFKTNSGRSIVAAIVIHSNDHEMAGLRYPDGRVSSVEGKTADGDLINVPEVTTKIANVYRGITNRIWTDYPDAPKLSGEYVGFIEWTLEDGEPVSCRFVPDRIHG